MKQIDIDNLKQIQLNILDYVMNFCAENNITCWLNGGTLLGAVRHKGYIPWDDDIDLGMLRPDYDKFMALFNKHTQRYKFRSIENDPECFTHFGKVFDTNTILYEPNEKGEKLAVYVDIFVMDNAPADKEECRKMFRKRDILYICNLGRKFPIFLKPTRGGFIRSLIIYAFRAFLRIFPRHYFVKKLIENSKSCKYTGFVGDFTGLRNAVCPVEKLSSVIQGSFEGKNYNIPVGYDEWLKALYGDYMQMPPENKRISTHKFKAYTKD